MYGRIRPFPETAYRKTALICPLSDFNRFTYLYT
ncbi:hypothetical protein [Brochothrix phage ADU4]|nr:hypothetical protein [Brochothrix phage ADU4]